MPFVNSPLFFIYLPEYSVAQDNNVNRDRRNNAILVVNFSTRIKGMPFKNIVQ